MRDISRRLGKIEKQLHISEKPHLVVIGSMEMDPDEFRKLLKEIDGNSKGKLPNITELQECQAMSVGDIYAKTNNKARKRQVEAIDNDFED